jgi:hypothetical protein
MTNASETYQGTLARPVAWPKERVRLALAIAGVAILVVACSTIEPLRQATGHFFESVFVFSALVAG